MDITWTGTVFIAAPVEQVYAYLVDLPRHAEWAQSVQRLALVRAGDHTGVGAVYRSAERQGWQANRRPFEPLTGGVPGDTMCELIEAIPERRIAWRSWAPVPGVRHEGWYAFEFAPADGGTALTQTASLRDNWLGDLVSRYVFKTTAAKAHAQWTASLRNIKLILESDAAPTGGQSTQNEEDTMDNNETTSTIVRRFFAEQDRLRGGPADELCAPGYTAHLPGGPPLDLAGHQAFSTMFYAGFPDLRHEVEFVAAEGDRAAARFLLYGTHTGEFLGIAPTGRSIAVSATAIMRLAERQVAELWGEFDRLGLFGQLTGEGIKAETAQSEGI